MFIPLRHFTEKTFLNSAWLRNAVLNSTFETKLPAELIIVLNLPVFDSGQSWPSPSSVGRPRLAISRSQFVHPVSEKSKDHKSRMQAHVSEFPSHFFCERASHARSM